jgi:hypothetical protein
MPRGTECRPPTPSSLTDGLAPYTTTNSIEHWLRFNTAIYFHPFHRSGYMAIASDQV